MDWIALLRAATRRFAEVLETGDLDAPVPACPDWVLADLADHLGGVHQWATHAVVVGNPFGQATPAPTGRTALARWYRSSARTLVDVLAATPVEARAWTFGPEQVAGFWRRRQVHETVLHLYDALASQERRADWSVTPELAWDGVDEVTTLFYPRQLRLDRTGPLPGTLQLVPEDTAGEPLQIGEGAPVLTLKAPAEELLLTLWKRVPIADPELAALVADVAITP